MGELAISADEAIPLLWDNGVDIHNMTFVGACWSREDAINAIKTAKAIYIRDIIPKHRLFVEQSTGRKSYFETDDEKVAAFLKERGNE